MYSREVIHEAKLVDHQTARLMEMEKLWTVISFHIYVQGRFTFKSVADHPRECQEDLGYQSFRSCSHLLA
jgi:hypothetical protein